MEELLSVIIIRCDDNSDLQGSLESVLSQKTDRIECIVADAADGQSREMCACGGILFADISEKLYENTAQVKNEAVRLASCENVLILTAGQILEYGVLHKLLTGLSTEINNSGGNGEILFKKYFLEGIRSVSYLVVNRESFGIMGGWNEKLPCAEDYELMLRACDFNCTEGFCAAASENEPAVYMETYFTYAYLLGKYVRRLKGTDIFDEVFTKWYTQAVHYGAAGYFRDCAEEMIVRQELFKSVDFNTRPILVFTHKIECNGTLASFAYGLGTALRKKGQSVQIINLDSGSLNELNSAIVREYRAVIGIQTSFFTQQLGNGELAGNIFKCPKFNYLFDHPLYLSYFLMLPVNDFYVLQQDESYAAYIKKYFNDVKKVWHFPPAGIIGAKMRSALGRPERVQSSGDYGYTDTEVNTALQRLEKTMDISFVATYNDYRERLAVIRTLPADIRHLSWQMVNQLKNNPKQSAEEALACVLKKSRRDVTEREFVVLLHKSCEAVRAVSFYYRERIVKVLLDAGLKVDVFGTAWRRAPYADNPNLIIHGDVGFEEGLDVMAESRISLNVMTWHKGGMTERVANSMLNGSVCVTDETTYINRNFTDGENIVTFELDNIEALPGRLKEMLRGNKKLLDNIAANAFQKAIKEHTWDVRAQRFLSILAETEEEDKQ